MTTVEPPTVEFPFRHPGEPFPPPVYADYRCRSGLVSCILPDGNRAWLITRYDDVRTVLTHPGISSNPEHPGFPHLGATLGVPRQDQIPRSEEHTSELQSLRHLVCRLLLEK